MFLKSLIISSNQKTIREISFRKGINLIVDETLGSNQKATGNNIGKTTVLKLIDFCLGAEPKMIYEDPESKGFYALVKEFLLENRVTITLTLKEDLDIDNSFEIKVERNFLTYKNKIQRINGDNFTEDEFEIKLSELIFPKHKAEKPTFRQIISHNIRYKDENINNTLNTLGRYAKGSEYETLYLFLFGCSFENGKLKQEILEKMRQEKMYKNRLERQQTKNAYEIAVALINTEIEKLNEKKKSFNLNKDFEADLDKLNRVRYQINRTSYEIGQIKIRKDIIIESEKEINAKTSEIDIDQLRTIYQQAVSEISGIQKTFVDLVNYHNQMIVEKVRFIKKELPNLEIALKEKQVLLQKWLGEEQVLASMISKGDSFEELERVISELNDRYRKKGEYEKTIEQLNEVEVNIEKYGSQLGEIDGEIFSKEFEQTVKNQLNKFNRHFSSVSNELYGEQYAVKYDVSTNRNSQKIYKFTSFNANNISSGKKQGEIFCFDIAYILFADEEKMSCLHFLLNDKKELMHDNQLVKISEFVNNSDIQFVVSILKDKLPTELNKEEYFVVKLSQQDKLFRIED